MASPEEDYEAGSDARKGCLLLIGIAVLCCVAMLIGWLCLTPNGRTEKTDEERIAELEHRASSRRATRR